jgi:hypothetical protein
MGTCACGPQPRAGAWHPSHVSFLAASAIEPLSATQYRALVPDGWQQGRAAFGGLVLGTLLRAIEHAESNTTATAAQPSLARATRTLTGDLCGPVLPGPVDITVHVLRRGNNQSNLFAELTQQGGAVLATANAVLSTARLSSTADARAIPAFVPPSPPPTAPWRDQPPSPIAPPVGPVFTQHYEYRPTTGGPTGFAATGEAFAEGWIRERAVLPALDAPALIGRLDAWWPALFALDGAPRPVATISFAAQILVDPASLPPDEPLRHRARLAALHDGFFVELRELWRGDRIVALNQQTFAILR